MKTQNTLEKCKGLTIIELLVAMTILSALIGLTLSVLFKAYGVQKRIDTKYSYEKEADRIVREIENSLRLAQGLLSGTNSKLKFLDVNNDATEYSIKGDTLVENMKQMTSLAVDSLCVTYVKVRDGEKIADFYILDLNNDGILDAIELSSISGIGVYVKFFNSRLQSAQRTEIERQFFVLLRNSKS